MMSLVMLQFLQPREIFDFEFQPSKSENNQNQETPLTYWESVKLGFKIGKEIGNKNI